MSKSEIGKVVQRAIGDAAFRRQLQSDPAGALKGFDLTSDERAALHSGDAGRLSSMGVDQRMSKVFALGEVSSMVSRHGTGGDLAGTGVLTTGEGGADAASHNAALVSTDDGRSALISDGTAGANQVLRGDNAVGANAVLRGDNAVGPQAVDNGGADGANQILRGDDTAGANAVLRGDNPTGSNAAIIDGGDTSLRGAIADQGGAGAGGSAYISADEAGRDYSAISTNAGGGGATGDAFMTADEAARDYRAADSAALNNANVHGQPVDSADVQRELLQSHGDGGAMSDHAVTGDPEITA